MTKLPVMEEIVPRDVSQGTVGQMRPISWRYRWGSSDREGADRDERGKEEKLDKNSEGDRKGDEKRD